MLWTSQLVIAGC